MSEREPNKNPSDFEKLNAKLREYTKETVAVMLFGIGMTVLGDKTDNDLLEQVGAAAIGLSYVTLFMSWIPKMTGDTFNDTKEVVVRQVKKIKKRKK